MVWTIVGTAVTVMALENLKPPIQGPNQSAVIVAVNNLLEFLKP
jgi:hypothetical protein